MHSLVNKIEPAGHFRGMETRKDIKVIYKKNIFK